MKLRYRLIEWLAKGDLIVLNAYFGGIGSQKDCIFSNMKSSAVITLPYKKQNAVFINNWFWFDRGISFDPFEPFPQPEWFYRYYGQSPIAPIAGDINWLT